MPWFSKKRDYKGRHVFISGGSTGIGLALAKEFMLLGASATVVARTQSKLEKAVEELQDLARARSLPGRAQGLSADVTDNTEVHYPAKILPSVNHGWAMFTKVRKIPDRNWKDGWTSRYS